MKFERIIRLDEINCEQVERPLDPVKRPLNHVPLILDPTEHCMMIEEKCAFAIFTFLLLGCISCTSEKTVYSKDGYEEILKGADTLLHQQGNEQLWYSGTPGKRSLIWSYVTNVRVYDGVAIWSGGLIADPHQRTRWKVYPALFASENGGSPIELTEMATRKYCLSKGINYELYAGFFGYNVEFESRNSIRLVVSDGPGAPKDDTFVDVKTSKDEVQRWLSEAKTNSIAKSYDGVQYLVPRLAASMPQ